MCKAQGFEQVIKSKKSISIKVSLSFKGNFIQKLSPSETIR